MAENGAALQSYNNELVKCIEDLCSKRDDVSREIKMDEQEKEKLEHDIAILHERLQKVVTNLARKTQIRDEYGNFYKATFHPKNFRSWVVPSQFQVPLDSRALKDVVQGLLYMRFVRWGVSSRWPFCPNLG